MDFTSPNHDDTVLPREPSLSTRSLAEQFQAEKCIRQVALPCWPENKGKLFRLYPSALGLTIDSLERRGEEFTTDHGELDLKRMLQGDVKNRRRVAMSSSTTLRSIVIESLPTAPKGLSMYTYLWLLSLPLESLLLTGLNFFYYDVNGELKDLGYISSLTVAFAPQQHSKRISTNDDTRIVVNSDNTGFIQKMMTHYYDGMLRDYRKQNSAEINDATLLARHLVDNIPSYNVFNGKIRDFFNQQHTNDLISQFTFHIQEKAITVTKEDLNKVLEEKGRKERFV
jgi:hypothetical protein